MKGRSGPVFPYLEIVHKRPVKSPAQRQVTLPQHRIIFHSRQISNQYHGAHRDSISIDFLHAFKSMLLDLFLALAQSLPCHRGRLTMTSFVAASANVNPAWSQTLVDKVGRGHPRNVSERNDMTFEIKKRPLPPCESCDMGAEMMYPVRLPQGGCSVSYASWFILQLVLAHQHHQLTPRPARKIQETLQATVYLMQCQKLGEGNNTEQCRGPTAGSFLVQGLRLGQSSSRSFFLQCPSKGPIVIETGGSSYSFVSLFFLNAPLFQPLHLKM